MGRGRVAGRGFVILLVLEEEEEEGGM
jgi:hypothetical protein